MSKITIKMPVNMADHTCLINMDEMRKHLKNGLEVEVKLETDELFIDEYVKRKQEELILEVQKMEVKEDDIVIVRYDSMPTSRVKAIHDSVKKVVKKDTISLPKEVYIEKVDLKQLINMRDVLDKCIISKMEGKYE